MGRTLNVSLGMTLCTDPENRNFIRVHVGVDGIDPDGDAVAQAQSDASVAIEVIEVLDDKLRTVITEVIAGSEKPGLVREALANHDDKFLKIGRVMTMALRRLDKLEEDGGTEGGE